MNLTLMPLNKIPVGVSSCLLGENVRYDGGNKKNDIIVEKLSSYFEFYPLCPEVGIGLGTPRPPIHLVKEKGQVMCVEVDNPENDYTQLLKDYADQQRDYFTMFCGYIFKKDSPSCGQAGVKIYQQGETKKQGTGVFAEQLIKKMPLLPVEEEDRLADSKIRESFIQRVELMYHWKQMQVKGLSLSTLLEFHQHYKSNLLSEKDKQALAELLIRAKNNYIEEISEQYIVRFMVFLKAETSNK